MWHLHVPYYVHIQSVMDYVTPGGSRYVPGSRPQKAASGPGYDPFTGMYLHEDLFV